MEYTKEEIHELAKFRAMLLSMLVEGIEYQEDDESVITKIDWFFKMNDTQNLTTQVIEESTGAYSAIIFQNDVDTVLIAKADQGKITFYTTTGIQDMLAELESENADPENNILKDIGVTMLFVIQALHSNGIVYNLPTEISTETESPDDDWAV